MAMELDVTVSDDDIASICQEVWSSFVDDLIVVGEPEATAPDEERLTGCVHVVGGWRGAVMVEVAEELGRVAAAAMFAIDPDGLGPAELADALGELANIIGGNVKSLLPAPATLSTPTVAAGPAYLLRMPGAHCLNLVRLHWNQLPLTVTIWQS